MMVWDENPYITYLQESTKTTGHPKHRPGARWLVVAASVLVGFVVVDVMPIQAVVLALAMLGVSALRSLGRWRRMLFAIGLGLTIPTVLYFILAIAEH
jgi:hypothetical protein